MGIHLFSLKKFSLMWYKCTVVHLYTHGVFLIIMFYLQVLLPSEIWIFKRHGEPKSWWPSLPSERQYQQLFQVCWRSPVRFPTFQQSFEILVPIGIKYFAQEYNTHIGLRLKLTLIGLWDQASDHWTGPQIVAKCLRWSQLIYSAEGLHVHEHEWCHSYFYWYIKVFINMVMTANFRIFLKFTHNPTQTLQFLS